MSAAPAIPTPPAIEMHGVSAGSMRDLSVPAVTDVNWSVATGDFWVIGGLQGSGKSDFMMMAAGLSSPQAGGYDFFGHPMPIFEDARLPERLRLGFVFENGQLFNHLTIAENISLPLRYHHNLSKTDAAEETQRMLELIGMTAWADGTPGALSRNWQKRAALGRALMIRPDVLLLDNPLAGLDLRHRAWWLNFLEKLSGGDEWMNGRPVTLVATTDDLRPWRNRARQFAILKNKKLISLGSWEHVEAASDDLVHELLAAAPRH